MKRYILSAALMLGAAGYAQEINSAADALRYGQDNLTGTARFRAMSGAFGALGGDISAINVNPAGSAIFNYNTGTASVTSFNITNKADYFGTTSRKNHNSFELNQVGGVWVFQNNNPEATWQKFTIGLNYDNTNNFDNRVFSRGTNPTDNLGDYFVPYAQGVRLNTLENSWFENLNFAEQQAYLGYNAYIFDPANPNDSNNTSYIATPAITGSNGYYQEHSVATTGYQGKVALNFGTQFRQWLYLGANLNVHFTDYIKTTSFYESYNTPGGDLRAVRFNTERYTYGGGFSMNVGAIAKVTEDLRVGVAYESPTWYSLQDELRQNIASTCIDCGGTGNSYFTDPGITMLLNDYSLRTPGKWTGSLAYVFGKIGLLSIDAGIKDYGNTRYTSNRFGDLNYELGNTLGLAREVRIGGEVRLKSLSVRGGVRYEESPYKNNNTISDLKGFSAGFGYAFGNSRLDLAYSYFHREISQNVLEGNTLSIAPRVNSNNNNVTLSYSIDL